MGKVAAIPETHKPPMLLASIDLNCSLASTLTSLGTKEVSELNARSASSRQTGEKINLSRRIERKNLPISTKIQLRTMMMTRTIAKTVKS